MKLFLSYIRKKAAALFIFLLLMGLAAAVMYLYELPLSALGYAALLCVFVGGIAFAVGFSHYAKKHRMLAELRENISLLSALPLPEPEDAIEADTLALLAGLSAEAEKRQSDNDRRFREMTDYYTIWAHQIKTPIAAMQLMLQQGETDPAALREQVQRIEQYVEMALGYLRLDSESSDYVLGTYDLDSIVRPAVKKYASQFIRRKIRLSYEPLETQVLTDEKWLRFVIEQVLSNALKYTPAGSVTITMEPEKTLVVRDTGIGIRAEDLPRVFEKGYTGFNGRTDRASTGIGLYLCRRVCDALGHTISVASVLGEGTAVRIGLDSVKLDAE